MKKIICDIDDTISFTTNRDWKNAKPNIPLIKKLNQLYNDGVEIIYETARGCLSFKGDRKAAEKYYRPIIEEWFEKNNVKYTKLSFQKHLADYYIDDRAIKPQEFLELDVEILQGGLSGAEIEKRGNRVYKIADNSYQAASWYNKAKNICNVPKIYSVIGDTLCMEYIETNCEPKIEDILKIIEKFKKIHTYVNFDTYIQRIEEHLRLSDLNIKNKNDIILILKSIENFMDNEKSFCHGDFSLDNILCKDNKIYLIDPIYTDTLYSSWLLDVSKLKVSAKRFNNEILYKYVEENYNDYNNEIKILEISHWIRMLKYIKNNKLKQFAKNEINNLINEIF